MSTTKNIFVLGGVASSLGKGIISASLAKLLQARGFSVTIQKLDPYINIDPGTLNPYEHGECYVTEDGAETDLDLGHYERFTNEPTSQANNITTGRVYQNVINKERKGDYLGKTVQVIPHITDEIMRNIKELGKTGKYDFVITEIGGTVGDIESLPYVEAVRQMRFENYQNVAVILLTYVPYLKAAGELKTKPTQHSVKTLQESGVQPDIIVCRTEYELSQNIRDKIALFCNVPPSSVIESIDLDTIYEVPLKMQEEKLDVEVLRKTRMPIDAQPRLDKWKDFLFNIKHPAFSIKIALVGKYTELPDAYKSITESFIHAGAFNHVQVDVKLVQAESDTITGDLSDVSGILVAPGFGERGIEGKIKAIQYAREHQVPFLGICLGMQMAVVEFARNVLGHQDAHSSEMNPHTHHPVIDLMENQKEITNMGGTMRLGAYACELTEDSNAFKAYDTLHIRERHRHRYEFNNSYRQEFENAGMIFTGINPDNNLVEIVEIPDHPWFVGVQFHPEYKSTVVNPAPLFVHFVRAAIDYYEAK
jgi:CTP synthase